MLPPFPYPQVKCLLAALSALWFLACGGPPEPEAPALVVQPIPADALSVQQPVGVPGATLIETVAGDLATFNPLVNESATGSAVIGRLLDSLVTLDPDSGEVIPNLAHTWEISEDQLQYTFFLRKGVCWSDGHAFTADDVVFTWNAFFAKKLDPATGQPLLDEQGRPQYRYNTRATFSQQINGQEPIIEKLDAHTVRFTTPEVYAPFLLFGGGQSILPKHALQTAFEDGSLLDQWSLETAIKQPWSLVSLNAFTLEAYRPGERMVLKRNPNYWKVDSQGQRLPYIERIITKIVQDVNSSNIAFAQGLTDIESIAPDNVAWVKRGEQAYDYKLLDMGPSSSTNFIWFNQKEVKNAAGEAAIPEHRLAWFRDARFRRAISYGIDREGIIQGVYFNRAHRLDGYVSPKRKFWYNPAIRTYPYQPQKARQLLLDMGFQDRDGRLYDAAGHPLQFSLMTNSNNGLRVEMATVFKENMAAIGVSVDLQFLDFNTLVTKISGTSDYEACMLGLGGGAPDPYAGKDILMSGGRLHFWNPQQAEPATAWEARIDELMRSIGRHTDVERRKADYFEVQAILAEQQPMIFLVSPKDFVGYRTAWHNIRPTPLGGITWNLESLWRTAEP